MVKSLIDPKKSEEVRKALKKGDIEKIFAPKKPAEKPAPQVETPAERPTPVPPSPTSGAFGKPAAQGPFERPTVVPPLNQPAEKQKRENLFKKYAPLVDELPRARPPRSKEELNRELLGLSNGRKEIEKILKEGADVDARNSDGWTPLMRAAANGYAENCKTLVDAGADVNASDPNGYTALMGAASIGNTKVVLLLIESGADVNAKENGKGRTALDFAKTWGRTDVIAILKNHGATEAGSDG